MRNLLIAIIIFAVSIAANFLAISNVSRERAALKKEEGTGLLLPASISRIVAIDYKGLLADFIFSRSHSFYGGKLIRKEKLSNEEWIWIYESAALATDLDPYFLDPYLLGATNLAWESSMVKKANLLLEKAIQYRTWDWTLPFYLGFNHYYFFNDNEKASEYLMQAAKMPGGSGGFVPTLAARLAYKGRQTENSVIFLEEILKKTDDQKTRAIYELRLNSLKGVLYLEKAVDFYQKKFGRKPQDLNQLIAVNIIKQIPVDPYGGKYYIDTDGSIKTTSDLNPTWAK